MNGVSVYRDCIRIVLRVDNNSAGPRPVGTSQRGVISSFSEKSAKRMSDYLSSCVAPYRFMGTLTVREWENDGRAFKASMEKYFNWKLGFMQRQRNASVYGGESPNKASIFWFLEFQARGAPHLHYFYTDYLPWFDCANRWAEAVRQPEIVKSCSKFEKIRAGRRGVISYARKYAAKQDQKLVPENYDNVGRFWGIRGMRDTLAAATTIRTERALAFLRNELYEKVQELEKSGEIRVFRWKDRPGMTVACTGSNNLLDLGLMEMVDNAIVADVKDRYQLKLEKWNQESVEAAKDGLWRQRRRAGNW